MRRGFWPRGKLLAILGIVLLYLAVGGTFWLLATAGDIKRLAPTPIQVAGNDSLPELAPSTLDVNMHLSAAAAFFRDNLLQNNGHIDLYRRATSNGTVADDNDTNSEAVSYYLLWTAQAKEKTAFDKELSYVQEKMVQPVGGYLQWRLTVNDTVVRDGGNIASDADLRAIKALLVAERQWGDQQYTDMITQLAKGLERTAITKDDLLAPYGGMSGTTPWTANESYISYSDFAVFRELSRRRGEPWTTVYAKMKAAVLGAQIQNGLYNSQLTASRQYGNGIDGGGYSINSMWIMVRNAESGDPDLVASANRSLAFYKQQFARNAELDTLYSSNGDALSSGDSPWAYALIGRAAIALGDTGFSDAMMAKLLAKQVTACSSSIYGAFPEGDAKGSRIGQFTMQEAILTMQDYLSSRGEEASFQGPALTMAELCKKGAQQ